MKVLIMIKTLIFLNSFNYPSTGFQKIWDTAMNLFIQDNLFCFYP